MTKVMALSTGSALVGRRRYQTGRSEPKVMVRDLGGLPGWSSPHDSPQKPIDTGSSRFITDFLRIR
jgi:hypothetical protein